MTDHPAPACSPAIPGGAELNPDTTALVIVDMMNRFCDPAWLGRHDDAAQVAWYRRELEGIIPRIRSVLESFRRRGALVVHVLLARWTPDAREVVPYQRGREYDAFDTQAMSVIPELAPATGEIVIRKVASSAFQATGLDFMLRNAGIRQVVITGQFGDACCFYTLIMSREAGFANIWVHDALLFSNEQMKQTINPLVAGRWAESLSAEELVRRLEPSRAAAAPIPSLARTA